MNPSSLISFIRKLYGTPSGTIPLHAPMFSGNEKKYLEECIDSTFVSSVGKFVDEFEIKMAEFTGAKKAVACVNGTNALHLALLLAGVERDTEVITQPLTFIATANAISYCGASPVFIDVDMDTMGLSPQALRTWLEQNTEQKTTNTKHKTQNTKQETKNKKQETRNKITGKKISACLPMHTFGHPARIDEIVEICNEYNIPVVEDAAESLGSYYSPREIAMKNERGVDKATVSRGKGQHTGTFGLVGVLSFNGNKILTTGGGGMLLFNDINLAQKAKHLTTQAKVPHAWEFVHDEVGYNYRMPNLNAALGLAQLEQLPGFIQSKRETAAAYQTFFNTYAKEQNNGLTMRFIPEPENSSSNYWLNSILLENKAQRDALLQYTNQNGIMTRPVWQLMNRLPMFTNCQTGPLPNAEKIADGLVNLPSSVKGTKARGRVKRGGDFSE